MDKKIVFLFIVVIIVVLGVVVAIVFLPSTSVKSPAVVAEPTPVSNFVMPTSIPLTLPTIAPTSTPSAITSANKTFVVEAKDFSFSPTTIKVKVGDTVVVTFKNTQGLHDFVISGFDVTTNQIGEGDEEEVEFVANKKGTFE